LGALPNAMKIPVNSCDLINGDYLNIVLMDRVDRTSERHELEKRTRHRFLHGWCQINAKTNSGQFRFTEYC